MVADPSSHACLKHSLRCSIAKVEGSNPADGMGVLLLYLLCVV